MGKKNNKGKEKSPGGVKQFRLRADKMSSKPDPNKRTIKRPPVLVFDEDSRKEFVTGFRKRKDERRRLAQEQIAERARLERIEKRKEKRESVKEQIGWVFEDDKQDEGNGEEAEDADANETTYERKDGKVSTVVTSSLFSDSEDEETKPYFKPVPNHISKYPKQQDGEQNWAKIPVTKKKFKRPQSDKRSGGKGKGRGGATKGGAGRGGGQGSKK